MAKFEECILHIGSPKTGTTYLQETLIKHRDGLSNEGICIPPHGPSHQNLLPCFLERPEDHPVTKLNGCTDRLSAQKFAEHIRNDVFSACKNSNAKRVLFSCELFCDLNLAELQKLQVFLNEIAQSITVICYQREARARFISNQLEYIRSGVATLKAPKLHGLYWAHHVLPLFIEVFGKSALHIYPYEKSSLVGGDIAEDFFHRLNSKIMPNRDVASQERLSQLSHQAMILASLYNQTFPLFINGLVNKERRVDLRSKNLPGQFPQYPLANILPAEKFISEENHYIQNEFGVCFDQKEASNPKQASINKLNKNELLKWLTGLNGSNEDLISFLEKSDDTALDREQSFVR